MNTIKYENILKYDLLNSGISQAKKLHIQKILFLPMIMHRREIQCETIN